MTKPPSQQINIHQLWAKNFRSLADTSIRLEPLTILVGANGTGKSNILDALRFFKDALRFDLDAAIAFRHGFESIIRLPTSSLATFTLGVKAEIELEHKVLDIAYSFSITGDGDGEFHVEEEVATISESPNSPGFTLQYQRGRLVNDDIFPIEGGPALTSNDSSESLATNLMIPSLVRVWPFQTRLTPSSKTDDDIKSLSVNALRIFFSRLRLVRIFHIFPNTIRNEQDYLARTMLDESAWNLATVLRNFRKTSAGRISLRKIKGAMKELVPGCSDLRVIPSAGNFVVQLKHKTEAGTIWLNLSQESDGIIRLLGIVTALYQRQRMPMMGLEEPELTVHPGALATLADMLNEASQNSQILITTHSPDLIDCITNFRAIEVVRIVDLEDGATVVGEPSGSLASAVREHLFSPGELHRQGDLEIQSGGLDVP
ncbi:MAG: AAA family ATPase [Caldilineaceae bacterium]|nr:AAA family ATPase [Caldilineaceae bacterium]